MLDMSRKRGWEAHKHGLARQLTAGDSSAPPNVASNVRRARQQQGLSLETLARHSGVSRAMLGQIETGKSVPTITVIWKVAKALAIPAASLIASEAHVPLVVVRADELRTVLSSDGGFSQRPFLSPDLVHPFDFSEITLEPGHSESFSPLPIGGRATLVVKTGAIEAVVGDERALRLGAGDALLFQADAWHSLSNPGAIPATAYLVSTPRRSGIG